MIVWRVAHNRIHLHAYKVQIVRALKPGDKPRCFRLAKDILSNIRAVENYLWRWIFSDEATFYISGKVNRRNCGTWESVNPHAIGEIIRLTYIDSFLYNICSET
jgi:hypothetical protein